jgi:hypothetical protein
MIIVSSFSSLSFTGIFKVTANVCAANTMVAAIARNATMNPRIHPFPLTVLLVVTIIPSLPASVVDTTRRVASLIAEPDPLL